MITRLKIFFYLYLLLFLSSISLTAQQLQSDNGDGTFTNPVIYADFPDPDVIHVDSTYYFVSTTMFIFPGVTILKSNDLVNWEYCANVVQRMDYSPCYDLDGCNRYSHGQWASSIKYNNGKFYVMFNTLDDGGFLCTATNAEGPWDNINTPSWEWKQFANRFNLGPGNHTLTFAYREDGIRLDKINLAVNTDIPTGKGDAAENLCSTTNTDDKFYNKFILPEDFKLEQNYPNPLILRLKLATRYREV